MKLLLDTHDFIWFMDDDPALPATVKDAIEDPMNRVYLSVVNFWEIEIKTKKGNLNLGIDLEGLFNLADVLNVQLLDVEFFHLLELSRLPLLHNDPWDRMLIAQTIDEGMTFVTRDAINQRYSVQWMWS